MTKHTEELRSIIAEHAAQWFLLHREGEVSEAAREEFSRWLRVSPLHVQEYLAIAAIARDMASATAGMKVDVGSLSVAPEDETQKVVELPLDRVLGSKKSEAARSPRIRRRIGLFTGLAAAVILAAAAATTLLIKNASTTYRTAHGEQSIWPLPDGSVLQLNSDSVVTVRFSRAERLVEVVQGQAHFRVAHEAARRFRVVSGVTEVIAVGTEFDVYRMVSATVVTVTEGRVAVFAGAAPPPAPTATIPTDALRLGAGEQVRVDASRRLTVPAVADVRQSTAWMRRQIAFDHKRLGEVADEFNRYSNATIHIDDERLRALEVSGVFDAYDTDSFTGFLRKLDGVSVEVTPTEILVSRHSDNWVPRQ
jgi:transmembrane sensor